MRNRDWGAAGPAAAAAVLLLVGAWRVDQGGGEGWPLLVLGSVLVGVAIVIHVLHRDDADQGD